jgi:hypothetical protein
MGCINEKIHSSLSATVLWRATVVLIEVRTFCSIHHPGDDLESDTTYLQFEVTNLFLPLPRTLDE